MKTKKTPLLDREIETITDTIFISILIERIKAKQSPLVICLDGVENRFRSMISSLNETEKYIDINSIQPAQGNELFYRTKNFKIKTKVQGAFISFRSSIIKAIGDKNWHGYRITFPTTLEYRERRASHRIPIARDLEMNAIIQKDENAKIIARIDDISSEGIGLAGKATTLEPLQRNNTRFHCNIIFKDKTKLSCKIQTRRQLKYNDDSQLYLGAQFVDLTPKQSSQLIKQLRVLDRENVRRAIRG